MASATDLRQLAVLISLYRGVLVVGALQLFANTQHTQNKKPKQTAY